MSRSFGSLFSGIGGIDLGLERAGFNCKWQVENDPFCTKVLQKHWPNVARYGDIRTVDVPTLPRVFLLAGGFPCQPHSLARKRKASADECDLWGEFARFIRELRPRWILAENVMGLLSSEDGCFFGNVLRDLAQMGYDASWGVLSAAQFGAPHLRERVFVVAHSTSPRCQIQQRAAGIHDGLDASGASLADSQRMRCLQYNNTEIEWGRQRATQQAGMGSRHVANAYRFQQRVQPECKPEFISASISGNDGTQGTVAHTQSDTEGRCPVGDETPYTRSARSGKSMVNARSPGGQEQYTSSITGESQSCMGRDASWIPSWMDRYRWPAFPGCDQYEWEPSRVVTEKVPNRAARLKALGNAVVPQVAEYIGRAILECEASHV